MADTGYNWGSWAAMQKGAGDWSADAIADAATENGDATSLDGVAAMEIGITADTANSAVDSVFYVYVCGDVDGTNYEGTAQASYAVSFEPVQDTTTYQRFRLLGSDISSFKLYIFNDSGASITFTIKYRTATIPVAS